MRMVSQSSNLESPRPLRVCVCVPFCTHTPDSIVIPAQGGWGGISNSLFPTPKLGFRNPNREGSADARITGSAAGSTTPAALPALPASADPAPYGFGKPNLGVGNREFRIGNREWGYEIKL